MEDVLGELEHVLRSNEKEKITLEEELVLQRYKARAVKTFLTSASISSSLAWAATFKRFNTIARTSFSVGAALVFGGWTFDRSLHSSVQSILAARGTRMQRELTKIVMTKNLQNPASPISKIFYPEHVYDDSTQDKPLIRWRARNFYKDNVIPDSPNDALPSGSEPTEQTRNTGGDTIAGLGDLIIDPLDCILGYPETGGEAAHTGAVVSRRELRARKRRQRRHHTHHEKNYSNHTNPEILTV